MQILLIFAMVVGLISCKERETNASKEKFAAHPHLYSEYDDMMSFEFLIKKVDLEVWKVVYGLPPDCTNNMSLKQSVQLDRNLRSAVTESLHLWLSPLAGYGVNAGMQINYKEIDVVPRMNTAVEKDRKQHQHQPFGFDDNKISMENPQLKIVFYCEKIRSHSLTFPVDSVEKSHPAHFVPIIHLGHGDLPGGKNVHIPGTSFSKNVLLHEIGHAFGLRDTYTSSTQAGQPASVMYSRVFLDNNGNPFLTDDDIKGVQWLYKHYHRSEQITAEKRCFFEEYEFVKRACRPKHPLITNLKQAHAHDQSGNSPATNIFLNVAIKQIKEPNGDNGKINAQDDDGNTAFHLAVKYGNLSIKNAQLWDNVIAELKKIKQCLKKDAAQRKEDRECFESPNTECKCLDVNISNINGTIVSSLVSSP